MNLSLSKGGLPASVKNRAWQYCQMAWRGVTSKKALSRLAALSPLLLLGVGQMANGRNLKKSSRKRLHKLKPMT